MGVVDSVLDGQMHESVASAQRDAPDDRAALPFDRSYLPRFRRVPRAPGDRTDYVEWRACLAHSRLQRIHCFALGPSGTNIERASREWLRRVGVDHKASVILCDTPEQSLQRCRAQDDDEAAVSLFWTCAVFFDEYTMFFQNADVGLFASSITLPLDNMMLCHREGDAPMRWSRPRIACHPSPRPLLQSIEPLCPVVLATSNAAAAEMCRGGAAEMCVTTEAGARRNGLVAVHEFGSPDMVFFMGMRNRDLEKLSRLGIA